MSGTGGFSTCRKSLLRWLQYYKSIRMESNKLNNVGRPRRIDRDHVLDVAEAIVTDKGLAALTMDAVAQAAAITKGGVQYCFGNKDGLVRAIVKRSSDAFDAEVAELSGGKSDPISRIAAHIAVTRHSNADDDSRFAAMLASLIPNSEQLDETRSWYQQKLAGLDLATPEGCMARLALIANEGAFLLRSFNLLNLDDAEWQAVFDDITALQSSAHISD